MELAPGTLLLGKYRIDDLIGTGGMGNVVRASHLYLHQPVAIKILLPQLAESESTRQRFLREAQATVKLKSEHIARVIDVGSMPDDVPFMVMEYLDGNDLNQILRHHGPQQPSIVVDLMLQACEGIAEAHAIGIVHRDVKPSNFFITRRPDGSMLLKILDFGISKTPIGYEELTATQTVIGTPSYMAPEQMKNSKAADPRSDIWSIGVVMYQLLTGRLPFAGESYAELVLKVGLEAPAPIPIPLPTGLAEVFMRCLEKDPNARYQDVGEFARMLAPFATDPISAAQSSARAVRILQQRGTQMGTPSSPLTANGGLATPIPISPAQLTPRSWPPSQSTSLSQGAGQVTSHTRGGRGLVIAGIASLCVVAGVGGYAISQLSKSDDTRPGPHVQAPLPQAAVQPMPAPTPPAPAPPASAPPTSAPPASAPPASAPPASAPPASAPPASAPPASAPPAPAPAPDLPPTWHPTSPTPTIIEHPAADSAPTPPTPPTERKPAGTKPAGIRPTPDTKPAGTRPTPDAKPAGTKPAGTKPAKPTKPKKPDDLFDSRH